VSDLLSPADVSAVVKATTAEALRLLLLLDDAVAVQWQTSPVPKPREDTTQRASGAISDPTLATVLDERRLAVRQAVRRAASALDAHSSALSSARRDVEIALQAWEGSSE
jgi:hypothetical protein